MSKNEKRKYFCVKSVALHTLAGLASLYKLSFSSLAYMLSENNIRDRKMELWC